MRAVVIEAFRDPPRLVDVPDPQPPAHGVVVAVAATGVCRSDWHAWQGHDADVTLPHVPGHELAGTVVAVGADVRQRRVGDLVTTPFVTACGICPECSAGHQQVCRDQTQPGFTGWGSFAEFVALDHADVNLVDLGALADVGDEPAVLAAALGCRIATAFRAVTDVAEVRAGEWVAVHGCGGVGLAAIGVAVAGGARVVATDPSPAARALAREFGAEDVVDPTRDDPVAAITDRTGGGAAASFDAVGLPRRVRGVDPLPAPPGPARADRAAAGRGGQAGRADGRRRRPRAAGTGQPRDGGTRLPAPARTRRGRAAPAGPAGRADAPPRRRAPGARRGRYRHGGGGHRAAS